jgi:hypothetical protein
MAMGNEVFDSRLDQNSKLVLAMTNVHDALLQEGLVRQHHEGVPADHI